MTPMPSRRYRWLSGRPAPGRIGRSAADEERPRQLALGGGPYGGPVGAVAAAQDDAPFAVHRGAGRLFSDRERRRFHQHGAAHAAGAPHDEEGMSAGPNGGVPARSGGVPGERRGLGERLPVFGRLAAEVELELSAGQVPAAGQEVLAQRRITQGMARHQFGGRARHADAPDCRQAAVGRAALIAASQFVQHAGQAQERAGAHGGIFALGQHAVGIGSLGGLRLQKLEQLALRKNLGWGFRLIGRCRVVEQASGGISGHRVLVHGEKHAILGFAGGRRRGDPGAEALAGFRQGSAQCGGNPVRGLFEALLPTLRLHHAVLFEELEAKPPHRGHRHEGQEDQNEKQALRRFEPLP